jgi:hypothetical protein
MRSLKSLQRPLYGLPPTDLPRVTCRSRLSLFPSFVGPGRSIRLAISGQQSIDRRKAEREAAIWAAG